MSSRFTSAFSVYPVPRISRFVLAILIGGWGGSLSLGAQDIHFTQFHNNPLQVNPGLTGVFGGDVRFIGSYRSQWSSVPVDYETFVASVDQKFPGRAPGRGFFSGGLTFNYDQAGYSRLTYLSLGLNGSYTRRLGRHFYTTLGVQGATAQRTFDTDELTFDNQFDDERGQANLNAGHGEAFLENNTNSFLDFSAGINFRWQAMSNAALVDRKEKRSLVDLGLGIYHLNRPDQSFADNVESPLNIRLSPYLSGVAQLKQNVDVVGSVTAQFQRPYNQYLVNLGARLHLNRKLGKQLALQLSALFRFEEIADAVAPAVELHYNDWRFGFNYDVNISAFQVATNRRSGPEFSVRYIIRKVNPLPDVKRCTLI